MVDVDKEVCYDRIFDSEATIDTNWYFRNVVAVFQYRRKFREFSPVASQSYRSADVSALTGKNFPKKLPASIRLQ